MAIKEIYILDYTNGINLYDSVEEILNDFVNYHVKEDMLFDQEYNLVGKIYKFEVV